MNINSRGNIVDEIKSRCNIVDVVGRVVPLKKAGSNYKGRCPFHNEKTPSFVVSETKQIYTCFGCGATGDVINFVERYNSVDFKGAVEILAKEYGISLEGAFRSRRDKEEYYEINRQAARFFFKALRQQMNPGYAYMKNRGISEDTLNKFGIGYADNDWRSLYDFLTGQGISEEKLMEVGLISKSKGRYFDKFRDRVMFPIMNTAGNVIGFGGRIVGDGEPKYLNSQESGVFQKKNNLYGLNLTRKNVCEEDAVILVEGYMDVVSLYQSGVRNVSASLGTALTENQARLIKRYTKNVILSYDADNAGQNAAFRGLDILYKEGCRARVLRVTDGKDPDEYIKRNGKKAFMELVEDAVPYGDFKLEMIRNRYSIENQQGRIDYIKDAVAVLNSMDPVEADIYIKKLSEETGVSEGAIRKECAGDESRQTFKGNYESGRNGDENMENLMPEVEKDLIKLMLMDEDFINIPEDIRAAAFVSEHGKNIYEGILKANEGNRPIDIDRLKDFLDEDLEKYLKDIEEKVVPGGRERIVFEDCIEKIRKNILKEKERQILDKLSMADEDDNSEEIIVLTQKLIEIQKELKK